MGASPDAASRIRDRVGDGWAVVVGKGGVGKTTTAGALALSFADAGRAVHLLSTDPAHSLGDLFGVELRPGRPAPAPCAEGLILEELDARGIAERWTRDGRAPLLDLFDRGTWLDRADVEPFLDLTLPGIDEVAAVLRLSELAGAEPPRTVVVDTAPTGHALRMLDADDVLASWVAAFEAVASKAVAVAEGLTRRSVRLDAEEFVERLEGEVDRYRERVLPRLTAVVVERAGRVVAAETRRLWDALGELGIEGRVLVHVGAPPPRTAGGGRPEPPVREGGPDVPEADVVRVPPRSMAPGCEDLRAWGSPDGDRAGGAPGAGSSGGDAAARRDAVLALGAPLLLFVGKGGVGKTTCAAAWALGAAGRGPVTLVGADPADSVRDVLADGPLPGTLRVRVVQADADYRAFREAYAERVAAAFDRAALTRAAELDRRVVDSLVDLAPPGLDEIFAVVAILDEVEAGRRVVVDAAPTGHLLRLLALPETGLAWTRELMRTVLRYHAVMELDGLGERLLDFAKRLKDLKLRLADPDRAAAVVVRQPGPLVAAETDRLVARLQEAGIRIAAVVANLDDGTDVAHPEDVPLLRAPRLPEGPQGPAALEAFLDRWRVDR